MCVCQSCRSLLVIILVESDGSLLHKRHLDHHQLKFSEQEFFIKKKKETKRTNFLLLECHLNWHNAQLNSAQGVTDPPTAAQRWGQRSEKVLLVMFFSVWLYLLMTLLMKQQLTNHCTDSSFAPNRSSEMYSGKEVCQGYVVTKISTKENITYYISIPITDLHLEQC